MQDRVHVGQVIFIVGQIIQYTESRSGYTRHLALKSYLYLI